MPAIFEGVDDLIDRSLGVLDVGRAPHYQHKLSSLRLTQKPDSFSASTLFQTIVTALAHNWSAGRKSGARFPSPQNWRWEKKLYISENNASPEKKVEKAIAAACGEDWVNQVPTASGFLNSINEMHCNIDLIHRMTPEAYEFIELKYASGTPLYAAFEVLKYGLLYVFTRQNVHELEYSQQAKPILGASAVHLRVLAPADYYQPFRLEWLQPEVNAGLADFLRGKEYTMDFRFDSMVWPHDGDVVGAIASRRNAYCP